MSAKKDTLIDQVNKEVTLTIEKQKQIRERLLNNYDAIQYLNKQASEMNVRSVAFGRQTKKTDRKMRFKKYKYFVYLLVLIVILIMLFSMAGMGR